MSINPILVSQGVSTLIDAGSMGGDLLSSVLDCRGLAAVTLQFSWDDGTGVLSLEQSNDNAKWAPLTDTLADPAGSSSSTAQTIYPPPAYLRARYTRTSGTGTMTLTATGKKAVAGPKGLKGDDGDKGADGTPGPSDAAHVTIADAGNYFDSTTVEGALQEVGAPRVLLTLNNLQKQLTELCMASNLSYYGNDYLGIGDLTGGNQGSGSFLNYGTANGEYGLSTGVGTGAGANYTRQYSLSARPVVSTSHLKKWAIAIRFALLSTPDANTICWAGLNGAHVGVSGADSTTKYSAKIGATTIVATLGASIDTAYHTLYLVCDTVHLKLYVDDITTVAGQANAVDLGASSGYADSKADKAGGSVDHQCKIDFFGSVSERDS